VLPIEDVGQLDLLIEIGARMDAGTHARVKNSGGKIVSYMAGNALVMNFECVANGTPYGEILSDTPFDAAWLTPQHWNTNAGYAALTRSDIVRIAPHLWHPICLLRSISEVGSDNFYWNGAPINGESWSVGIFDPGINVVKTQHLPLLVCEEAYRLEPSLIKNVLLFSANHLIGNDHFEQFSRALDLGKDKKIFAESRHIIASVIGTFIDAVATHQWENNLNYLYWDILYSGRPLIHNSNPLANIGYYYPEFDPNSGGKVMADALRRHSFEARSYRAEALDHLWQYNPDNPNVQSAYKELIDEVMDKH